MPAVGARGGIRVRRRRSRCGFISSVSDQGGEKRSYQRSLMVVLSTDKFTGGCLRRRFPESREFGEDSPKQIWTR